MFAQSSTAPTSAHLVHNPKVERSQHVTFISVTENCIFLTYTVRRHYNGLLGTVIKGPLYPKYILLLRLLDKYSTTSIGWRLQCRWCWHDLGEITAGWWWKETICMEVVDKIGMTSKIKVMSPWKSEIRPFSNAISSLIYNGGWQMTTHYYIRAQYPKLIGARFLIFYPSFGVTWFRSWQ